MVMKIDFEFTTKYGTFRDALYLNDDHTLSEEEINTLKQERLDNWLFSIQNPPEIENEVIKIGEIYYTKTEIDGKIILTPVEN